MFPGGVPNDADIAMSTIHLVADKSAMAFRSGGKKTIRIDGVVGDIELLNADCAEDFEVDASQDVEPGSVLVVGEDGRLRLADQPYDRRVAGVVSGAGGLRPGIVLGRHRSHGPAVLVSLQ